MAKKQIKVKAVAEISDFEDLGLTQAKSFFVQPEADFHFNQKMLNAVARKVAATMGMSEHYLGQQCCDEIRHRAEHEMQMLAEEFRRNAIRSLDDPRLREHVARRVSEFTPVVGRILAMLDEYMRSVPRYARFAEDGTLVFEDMMPEETREKVIGIYRSIEMIANDHNMDFTWRDGSCRLKPRETPPIQPIPRQGAAQYSQTKPWFLPKPDEWL
jgi:hypothetical protein